MSSRFVGNPSPRALTLLGLVALTLSFAASPFAHARECGSLDKKPSEAKCHLPRDCASGVTVDVGKFQVGVGGSGSQGVEACCRVLEYVPAHHDKKDPAEFKLKTSSIAGWTKVGTCSPGSLSILGIISIPIGERTCQYGAEIATTIVTYDTDGYCDEIPGSS